MAGWGPESIQPSIPSSTQRSTQSSTLQSSSIPALSSAAFFFTAAFSAGDMFAA